MKRITERDKAEIAVIPYWFKSVYEDWEDKVAEKLAQYEDLEERGFLSETVLNERDKMGEDFKVKELNLKFKSILANLDETVRKLNEIGKAIEDNNKNTEKVIEHIQDGKGG